MTGTAVGSSESVRAIIDRAVESNAGPLRLSCEERELLSTWINLQAASDVLAEIEHIASSQLPEDVTPQALVGRIDPDLAQQDTLLAYLKENAPAASAAA